jgi:hypothetical protein
MLITTTIDVSGALSLCDTLLRKIPYAMNNALTRTAKELVEFERAALVKEFKVRKDFILRLVRITKYSTPDSLWTRVAIDRSRTGVAGGSTGKGGPVLLAMFEAGGTKEPERGTELADPPTGSAVRPNMDDPQTPRLMYKMLRMQKQTTSGGKIQFKGQQRTFIVAGVGVFQRTSSRVRGARAKKGIAATKGKDEDVVLLYRFSRSVPLRAQMHFVRTARDLVSRRFGVIWREEFVRELAGRVRK